MQVHQRDHSGLRGHDGCERLWILCTSAAMNDLRHSRATMHERQFAGRRQAAATVGFWRAAILIFWGHPMRSTIAILLLASVTLGGCFEGPQGPPGPTGAAGAAGAAGV